MIKSEAEKAIRIPVVLHAASDDRRIDLPGLIAIPSERLECFEELASELFQMRASYLAWLHTPSVRTSDDFTPGLRCVMTKLDDLLEYWTPTEVAAPPSDASHAA
jgi:hypothetical protein